MHRLRRGEAGGVRWRRASPAPPPDVCSNIRSILLKVNPLGLGCVKWQSGQCRQVGACRGVMRGMHPGDAVRMAGIRLRHESNLGGRR